MKVDKKVIATLPKCYAMSEVTVEGKHCFVAAAEKDDPCYLFAEDGTKLESIWTEMGGVMTITPVPGADGQFLSTRQFYSPNDGFKARIEIVTRIAKDKWETRTLCKAPFVHRFGILRRGGTNYLIVCCIKGGMEYKNDWSWPGATYGAVLPDDLTPYNDSNPLELTLLMDDMLKNHGYCKMSYGGYDAALIGSEEGAFLFSPPAVPGGDWEIEEILNSPTSDAVLADFDGDGKPELGVIAPFHGNSLTIYHLDEHDNYVPQWKYSAPEKENEMIHATWVDNILGKLTWVVGWRKGTKDTILITWDAEAGNYKTEFLDRNTGAANALHFVDKDGKDIIVCTNREIDELAYYTVTE